jgi:hypothetical protein
MDVIKKNSLSERAFLNKTAFRALYSSPVYKKKKQKKKKRKEFFNRRAIKKRMLMTYASNLRDIDLSGFYLSRY